jgi:hypothetical protein
LHIHADEYPDVNDPALRDAHASVVDALQHDITLKAAKCFFTNQRDFRFIMRFTSATTRSEFLRR